MPVEILPLNESQIKEAVSGWLLPEDAALFHEAIATRRGASSDLADRPLFLAHLVTAFKRQGRVPERPVELCRTIVRLVLQDWDEARGVQRLSTYAGFGAEEKVDLLSEVAYRLLIGNKIRFGEEDMESILKDIAPAFGLPENETRKISREIESHTGLIVQVGRYYEFSHLSIQEFLAGNCLARRPSYNMYREVWDHPELAAVATALTSDPSAVLEGITSAHILSGDELASMHQFLRRLYLERPRFVPTRNLGLAILRMITVSGTFDTETYESLLGIETVRQSLRDIMEDLPDCVEQGAFVYFTESQTFDRPERYRAPIGFVERVLGRPAQQVST